MLNNTSWYANVDSWIRRYVERGGGGGKRGLFDSIAGVSRSWNPKWGIYSSTHIFMRFTRPGDHGVSNHSDVRTSNSVLLNVGLSSPFAILHLVHIFSPRERRIHTLYMYSRMKQRLECAQTNKTWNKWVGGHMNTQKMVHIYKNAHIITILNTYYTRTRIRILPPSSRPRDMHTAKVYSFIESWGTRACPPTIIILSFSSSNRFAPSIIF